MKLQQLKKRTEGFTIIEVLIVLAIAGLIMLIVFMAIPALQRSQRNNARNTEGARITAQMTECIANYNGSVPACNTPAKLGLDFTNDFKEIQSVTFTNAAAGNGTTTSAVVHAKTAAASGTGFICNTTTNQATSTGAGPRDFAVTFQLEPTSSPIQRCVDSQ